MTYFLPPPYNNITSLEDSEEYIARPLNSPRKRSSRVGW